MEFDKLYTLVESDSFFDDVSENTNELSEYILIEFNIDHSDDYPEAIIEDANIIVNTKFNSLSEVINDTIKNNIGAVVKCEYRTMGVVMIDDEVILMFLTPDDHIYSKAKKYTSSSDWLKLIVCIDEVYDDTMYEILYN